MHPLAIDLETYSSINLRTCGLYKYVESPDFAVLLLAYAFDDEPVRIVDVAQGEEIPKPIKDALDDPSIIKTAWNAAFEIACLSKHFGKQLYPGHWCCSMVHSYYLGLPGSLEAAAKSLNLAAGKDPAGRALIRYFCVPCKPTKINGGRTRNLPEHDPERWEAFKRYCIQDVEVERTIRLKLSRVHLQEPKGAIRTKPYSIALPEREHDLWVLDQIINRIGILVDAELVDQAISCSNKFQERLLAEATKLTGLDNPNSVAQLKAWLQDVDDMEVESLSKTAIPELIKQTESAIVQRVLEIRQQLAKTSVKKYQAMQNAKCADDRVRGLLQFYGTRTGRWAGRLVQVQNLPRNSMPDLATARQLLKSGQHDALEMLFDSVPDVLSQLIRTAFIPSPGCRFIVADYSAIEARVVAWLAGEQWRLDVFNSHGKIYEASASQMFKVPIETIDKGNPLRQKGKIAELALGYGGSVGALKTMGALSMGLTEDELPDLVSTWRAANPAIVQLWQDLNNAALLAVRDKQPIQMQHGIRFSYDSGILFVTLPSGRQLCYVRPRIEVEPKFSTDDVTYEGQKQSKRGRIRMYGGKWAENLTQAIARDCLAEALLQLNLNGFRIAFHVHDEVVLDVPVGRSSAKEVAALLSQPVKWAPGLPMRAEAFEAEYYCKD